MSRPIPYKDLLDAAKHATGLAKSVPGKEHVIVTALPQWLGGEHWAITRHGDAPDAGTIWTGEQWTTSDLPADQIYCWTFPQVITQLSRAVADLSLIPAAWRAQHDAPAGLDDEFLAEFAQEVAS